MDIISNLEFSKKIKENIDCNYLFYGEEDYLKSHAVKSLKDAMGIDEALEIFNFVTLDVLDYTPDKLIDILSMPPMMAEKKLVVLSGLNIKKMTNKSDFNELLDALAHLDEFDYNVLVLTIPNGNITEEMPKKAPTGALKTLAERLQPVKFEAPTPQKLSLWVMRHFEHHGVKATQGDCAYLVDYCGKNMFTLANEIEKLALEGKPMVDMPAPKFKKGEAPYFSYSGLKTHVINYVHNLSQKGKAIPKADIACSFQKAAIEQMVNVTGKVLEQTGIKKVTIAGGVSANKHLREQFDKFKAKGVEVYYPKLQY